MLMMLLTTMTCMKAGRVRVTTGQGTQLLRQSTLHQYPRNNSGDARPGKRGLIKSGFVENIDIRKNRGSEVWETLGERQKSQKYDQNSRMAAELL